MAHFTSTEENMIKVAQETLKGRGHTPTTTNRDAYGCIEVKISNPHGEQYPDATGCVIYPSQPNSKDAFEFHWS